jgi:hypothetical protein
VTSQRSANLSQTTTASPGLVASYAPPKPVKIVFVLVGFSITLPVAFVENFIVEVGDLDELSAPTEPLVSGT